MKPKLFRQKLAAAIAYYAVEAPEYESLMDELANETNDRQWRALDEAIKFAEQALGESESGSLYQREKWLAAQEGRESRLPGAFWHGSDEEREQIITAVAADLEARGIRYVK